MVDREIFNTVRSLPFEKRNQFLDQACGDDDKLKARVLELLAGENIALKFNLTKDSGSTRIQQQADLAVSGNVEVQAQTIDSMKSRIGGRSQPPFDHEALLPGARIGPFNLRQQLGRGGMGEVWLAEQSEPVKRRVALKLIKPGIGSKEILARFEAERQALALMYHPNIARFLDAGTTTEGRSFFAMELVQGLPLTTYCDQFRLSINARLELFADVCHGVQHAHQKGIIHRDLKPSNILVTVVEDKAIPKVIDFGLAKAMESGQRLTEQSLFTGIGQVVGTLKYMSPEQASLDALDIDTRTDIYALGVILYEILIGSTPLDDATIKGQPVMRVLEVIRDKEPFKPSRKLGSSSNEQLSIITDQRRTDSARLNRVLTGDLDWIVMKALEKDRTRRYESAAGLAADIRRYLSNEPIAARPPSLNYRVRKFVRKNRIGVIAASFVVGALLLGIAGTTWGMFLASRLAVEERLANEQAQKRLAQIEKSNEILGSIFADLDIRAIKDGADPLESILAQRLIVAANELEDESVGDPLVVASLQARLGESLASLGYAKDAIELLQRSTTTRNRMLGAEHQDSIVSTTALALAYVATGEFDQALPQLEKSVAIAKTKFGTDHPETFESMNNLAFGYLSAGQVDRAVTLLEQVVEMRQGTLQAVNQDLFSSVNNNLASAYLSAQQPLKAIPLLEETLKLRQSKLGSDHLGTLSTMNNLASAYGSAGELDRAIPLMEQTLKLRKAKLGAEHPHSLTSMNNLAHAYQSAGRLDQAIPLFEKTLEMTKAKFGYDYHETFISMNNLASAYLSDRRPMEALPLLEQTLKFRLARLGADHPDTQVSINNMAYGYHVNGQPDKALPLLEQTLELSKAKLGFEHPETHGKTIALAMAYQSTDHADKALPLLEQLAINLETKNFHDESAVIVLPSIIAVSEQLGDFEVGDRWRYKWLAFLKEQGETKKVHYVEQLTGLGLSLLKRGLWIDAEKVLQESWELGVQIQPESWPTFNTQWMLGIASLGQQKLLEAEPRLTAGYQGMQRQPKRPEGQSEQQSFIHLLDLVIKLYTEVEQADEIAKWTLKRESLIQSRQTSSANGEISNPK